MPDESGVARLIVLSGEQAMLPQPMSSGQGASGAGVSDLTAEDAEWWFAALMS
jgi:hypothetical protein